MAIQWGKSPLHRIKSFRARRWFRPEFTNLAEKIAQYYQDRNEIVYGMLASEGATVNRTTLELDITAGEVVLNGRHYAMDAESDTDVFTTAGQIGQAIYSDGTDASGISITSASADTVYVSIIVCNSDNDGGIDSTDGGDALYVAVVNGTASAMDKTSHCTAKEIAAALEASTKHDGGESGSLEQQQVSWAYVAECVMTESGGGASLGSSFTANRNNAVSNN
tara:strand:- start:5089 stop:5754 length:666 start_codon:yes stop_codon:yes gene_type:complete